MPLLEIPIGRALEDAARRWPEGLALVGSFGGDDVEVRWTWADFDARAEAFAAGLVALGLAPGDRIGMWSLNTGEWALVQFAAAKAGLILVNRQPGLPPDRTRICL